ncbi:2-oxoglutarate receptor 1-like [Chanos chanos]|uniref:2-oxoglutarate receptor 1-like n=1 Tax=Chanos chanos TaxID=29144 RepID=A0A6J2VS31_CHACN|nr:2-oxoglutarate receptor 1-like [Chanos chanos]
MSSVIYYGNSTGNCTNVDYLLKRYYLPVMYGAICVVGVVGNLTSLLVYVVQVRPWRSCSIIMVNLAITDLFYMLSMPFLVYYYTRGDSWMLGDFGCRFMRFGFHFNLYGSILFLTCLAIFRYVAVVYPLKATQLQRKRWGITACVVVWILAGAQMAPMLQMISTVQNRNKTYCLDLASNDPAEVWWYGWMLTALGYLLPLVVVCVCYLSIARELSRPAPLTGNWARAKARARRLIVLVLTCFIVCFLPYHILRALRIYTRRTPEVSCLLDRWVHAVYIISRPLAVLNTVFNLALYTLAGDQFKKAFLSLFKCDQALVKLRGLVTVELISKPNTQTTSGR